MNINLFSNFTSQSKTNQNMQTTITVIAATETVSVKWTELGNVTLNVIENDYDKSVILSYNTLLQLAMAIVENHNKPITIAKLDKQGLI